MKRLTLERRGSSFAVVMSLNCELKTNKNERGDVVELRCRYDEEQQLV